MNDWIEWNGGEQPVENGTAVHLKFRGGDALDASYRFPAEDWEWLHEEDDYDIVAYRVAE